MWLADRSSPSALASASEYLRVNQLRARIKKRSHKYRDILTLRLVKKRIETDHTRKKHQFKKIYILKLMNLMIFSTIKFIFYRHKRTKNKSEKSFLARYEL